MSSSSSSKSSSSSSSSAPSSSGALLSDAWVDFVAGWCSGAVSVLACQPVDTVLTRQQAGRSLMSTSLSASSAAARPVPAHGGGAVGVNVGSVGVRALWRGSSAMIGAIPLQNALLMGGYGLGQQYAEMHNQDVGDGCNGNNNLGAIFIGGCCGGVLQSFVMSPVELVKVAQQCAVGTSRAPSTVEAGKIFLWQGGLLSAPAAFLGGGNGARLVAATAAACSAGGKTNIAWSGLGATLLRDGIPHGVWFVSYEMCKQHMVREYHHRRLMETDVSAAYSCSDDDGMPVSVPLTSGAVAATVAWIVGYPADLIKTRIQAAAAAGSTPSGIVETASRIAAEGRETGRGPLRALYRGLGLKLVRAVPASMIGFTVYEYVKERIQNWHH